MENNTPIQKKRVLSMIQPTGVFTLGNYLGALKNFVALQEDYECVYALADLHAITVRQDPAAFRKNSLSAYAMMLARFVAAAAPTLHSCSSAFLRIL